MPRAFPWHSKKSSTYHNNTACSVGKKIRRENRREGTGGKPLCQECAQLNRQGR